MAGIGFTVSLLVATLAFSGEQLTEAKLGILGAAIGATLVGSTYFTILKRLPRELRVRLALGRAEEIVDLQMPVNPEVDHVRGPANAPVTLVEYGDFECPYCGRAEPALRELLAEFGDELRFVFRDLPLADVHPRAQLAAEASEAAGAQGKFWEMHDLLFDHQDALAPMELVGYAEQLGLDVERFRDELRRRVYAPGIAEDVESADESNVAGTPTFFINGRAITARTTRRAWRKRCARWADRLLAVLAGRRRAADQGRQATSRSFCASARARSFFSVWCSIWRMRSRVTLNARPTSSSVSGARPSSP